MADEPVDTRKSRRPPARGAARARSPWRGLLASYFSHHRRVAADSGRRLWRAPVASGMTWLVMGIALALPVGLLLLFASLQNVSAGWESSARVTLYLEQQADTAALDQLRLEVAQQANVGQVQVLEKDDALAEFRASSGLADALDYLDANPLPHTLLVTPAPNARTKAGMEALTGALARLDSVDRVQVDLGWLQRLNTIADLIGRGAWALALLFGAAVVLVIGNTIRLAIESRRDEILVAKLVGGTDAFVRRPFLYTGLWYGLGGGIVAFALVQVTLWWISEPVERLTHLYGSDFQLSGLSLGATLLLLASAVVLGWLGAWLAVKRHLDAIEPDQI